MTRPRPRLTADQRAKIRAALDAGETIRGAARAGGVSFWSARREWDRWAADNGAQPSLPGVKPDALQRMIAAAVAEAMGQPAPNPDSPRPPIAPEASAAALKRLRTSPMLLLDLAAALDATEADAEAWLRERQAEGVNVQWLGDRCSVSTTFAPKSSYDSPILTIDGDDDDTFTLGALGDSHLCSKYQRLDVLGDLYDRYERAGVRHVFHTGNWIDGEARFNKHDLLVHGMDAQVQYLAEHYPSRPGITTYAVAGDDHEGWYAQATGVDIGRYAAMKMHDAGRSDWIDLGYMEAFVRLRNKRTGKCAMLHVVHPGGGSAYATSYTVQKIVESYAGGEKPAVLFAGHYHKMEQIVVRGVLVWQTGCQQDQTPFMRKKRLEAHVGGHIVRLRQDPETGAIVEGNGMLRYFNTGYYNNRWSHSGPVVQPPRRLGAQ